MDFYLLGHLSNQFENSIKYFFPLSKRQKKNGNSGFFFFSSWSNSCANFSVISAMYVNYDHLRKWSVLGHGCGQRLIGEKWACLWDLPHSKVSHLPEKMWN